MLTPVWACAGLRSKLFFGTIPAILASMALLIPYSSYMTKERHRAAVSHPRRISSNYCFGLSSLHGTEQWSPRAVWVIAQAQFRVVEIVRAPVVVVVELGVYAGLSFDSSDCDLRRGSTA